MKRYFVLALSLLLAPVLALATPWTSAAPAGKPGNVSVYAIQGTTSPATNGAPTVAGVGTDAGLTLANPQLAASQQGVVGVSVTICAATGATLSGAGKIDFYYYDPVLPEWSFVSDISITVTATTRCQTTENILINTARGRLFAAANGVTFSSGSGGVTIFLLVR